MAYMHYSYKLYLVTIILLTTIFIFFYRAISPVLHIVISIYFGKLSRFNGFWEV